MCIVFRLINTYARSNVHNSLAAVIFLNEGMEGEPLFSS